MATGPGFPQNNNTYVPPDISAKLRIGFSRNAKDFQFPRYWQYVETPFRSAYYLRLTTQEAARVINTTDFEWPDGSPDRMHEDGTESHNFVPFTTDRKSYKFRIGDMAVQQAAWPIVEQHGQIKAAQCMTARSIRGLTAATTAANWNAAIDTANLSANHTGTATALSGSGKFDVGTSTQPNLRIGLGAVAELINRDTLGVVNCQPDQMFLVMNPNTARAIAKAPEIVDYMKGSPWSLPSIKGEVSQAGYYNLPPVLFGYTVIVENAVKVTNKKSTAKATAYVLADDTILVTSRVGALDGIYGAPTFSTLTMFWWKDEMTVEAKHEDWDRLTMGRVVEDTFEAVTCPASGYLITATSN